MNALEWSYSGTALFLHMDGEKPLAVTGNRATEIYHRIINEQEDMSATTARSIWDQAKGGSAVARFVGAKVTNRDVYEHMSANGVRDLGFRSGRITFGDQPINGAVGRHIRRLIEATGHGELEADLGVLRSCRRQPHRQPATLPLAVCQRLLAGL